MNEIYVITFYNGESYEEAYTENWGYTNDEEKAKELVRKLDEQLRLDTKRYKYLESHKELLFDEKGQYKDNDYVREYKTLDRKYPYYWIGGYNNKNAEFSYSKIEKLELD